MTPSPYTEDSLVQQTTAEYLEQQLGWESLYAHNCGDFGHESLLGRRDDREVVLTRMLRSKLMELNQGLPDTAYDDALRQVVATTATQTLLATNREKYTLFRDGVLVTFQNEKGERLKHRLRLFDFDEPSNNHFLCVRELWIRGDLYRHRPDIVGFVNGLPLIFMEFKNIGKDIRSGYERNFKDYNDTIPHIFHHNALLIFGNGHKAKLGSITSRWEHFHEWKRLAEKESGVVEMETLLKGLCEKGNFMDLFENFIAFDDSSGETKKIIARNLGDDRHRGDEGEADPTKPDEELLADLVEAITVIRSFLVGRGASLDDIITKSGFDRNAALLAAKEAVNENNESRKCFEVMCRELFKKFKASINIEGVNGVRADYNAINGLYKSLQEDREEADITDITDIIRQFHHLVDSAIEVIPSQLAEASEPFDIRKIDFDRLRREFERSRIKHSAIQNLTQAIDNKLRRLMEWNPLRTNFQRNYEEIVEAYNREKDRPSIEKTFEELVRLVQKHDQEESRVVREGLDEEVKWRAAEIFRHVYRVYPRIPSPFYEKTVAA